jgi:hypothetical protein
LQQHALDFDKSVRDKFSGSVELNRRRKAL